jgi:hypothetical protein
MSKSEKLLQRFLSKPKDFTFEELSKLLNTFFTQYNLFSWLSVGLVGVPVVNAGIDSTLKLVTGGLPWVWQVVDLDGYVLLMFVFTGIGLLISALFWAL